MRPYKAVDYKARIKLDISVAVSNDLVHYIECAAIIKQKNQVTLPWPGSTSNRIHYGGQGSCDLHMDMVTVIHSPIG